MTRLIVMACIVGLLAGDRSQDDVLESSEMAYAESGGLAGRFHEARLIARAGTVTAEYRPPERDPAAVPLKGTVDPGPYRALWAEAEHINLWKIEPATKETRGTDLVNCMLTVRLGTRAHTIRWTVGAPMPIAIQAASQLGVRVLATARASTIER
jgi:hypothetical protein